jgi:hypothetical protein
MQKYNLGDIVKVKSSYIKDAVIIGIEMVADIPMPRHEYVNIEQFLNEKDTYQYCLVYDNGDEICTEIEKDWFYENLITQ